MSDKKIQSPLFLLITHHSSLITINKVSRPRGVAVEGGADEPRGQSRLKLFADAPQLVARRARVSGDERAPVGGGGDRRRRLAQRLRRLAPRERLDARRVQLPLGDEPVAVQ